MMRLLRRLCGIDGREDMLDLVLGLDLVEIGFGFIC